MPAVQGVAEATVVVWCLTLSDVCEGRCKGDKANGRTLVWMYLYVCIYCLCWNSTKALVTEQVHGAGACHRPDFMKQDEQATIAASVNG